MATTLRTISWMVLILGTVLIFGASVDYFVIGDSGHFIEEKGDVGGDVVWLAMLFAHVSSGLLALLSSLLQFSRKLLSRIPALHRWLGRIYVVSVLGILCPSGFYLALFAKGGFWGRLGFLLLGVLTFHFTLQGFLALRRGSRDMNRHIEFMIRSFAMLTTAITFRIGHLTFYLLGMDDATNYLVSLWLSIGGNALLAEWAIRRMLNRRTSISAITTPRTT
ncbi:DUF2306 domain-containing protein [Haloferula sp.]|uniref:DUF2306 domain-containing protein n=1 Tax=Haloferula sp. TaxID=2497595 RepID=UPI00329C9357